MKFALNKDNQGKSNVKLEFCMCLNSIRSTIEYAAFLIWFVPSIWYVPCSQACAKAKSSISQLDPLKSYKLILFVDIQYIPLISIGLRFHPEMLYLMLRNMPLLSSEISPTYCLLSMSCNGFYIRGVWKVIFFFF